jgi:hypothetical protein
MLVNLLEKINLYIFFNFLLINILAPFHKYWHLLDNGKIILKLKQNPILISFIFSVFLKIKTKTFN